MHQLVVHHPADALVGGTGFVDVFERLDAQGKIIVGHGGGAGVAVVVHVLQDDVDLFAGLIAEEAFMEAQGILKTAREVGNDVGLIPKVDQSQVFTLKGLEFQVYPGGRQGRDESRNQEQKGQTPAITNRAAGPRVFSRDNLRLGEFPASG